LDQGVGKFVCARSFIDVRRDGLVVNSETVE